MGKVERKFFCYAAMCFPHMGMFSFTQTHRKAVYAIMYLNSILKGCFFFVLKDFDQSYIVRVANNSQEKFTILHVPHVGFLCYLEWGEILLSKDE